MIEGFCIQVATTNKSTEDVKCFVVVLPPPPADYRRSVTSTVILDFDVPRCIRAKVSEYNTPPLAYSVVYRWVEFGHTAFIHPRSLDYSRRRMWTISPQLRHEKIF